MDVASRYPDRIERLVLADTTAWYGPDARERWTARAAQALDLPRRRQIPFQTERWFTDAFVRTRHAEVRRVAGVFTATDSRAHAAACRALGEFDARERLSAITAPTLVLTGEEDRATPPSMGRALADALPHGEFRLLPGLRHLSLVERPALAALVGAHLAGRPLPDLDDVDCGCSADRSAGRSADQEVTA
jgi:3-oxoadipate enol-lactonase